ncbi:diguanylate cyclase (GGDEF) domain-containing protein [Marinitoga piezophila KA3]|uniref:Diguanylate cyclase (GGDEF) domain-containing protein n=1 Tax=Marinitoga piezophila (strain DSM 14283 / JCM 11233 / KA3) TaxID=443254 RepID=H2J5M7_MARPK|nr:MULTISPECIES: GGDEF domain-containing protein [Marinitoga]AEX85013.1 diguanylate cyclase (GGDEF) domain-containing protein [Marinitoga piezophila KA3]
MLLYFISVGIILIILHLYFVRKRHEQLNNIIKDAYKILDMLPFSIVIHDKENIHYNNLEFKKMIGKDINTSKEYIELFPESERKKIIETYEALKQGKEVPDRFRTINNKIYYLNTQKIDVFGKQLFLSIYKDMTEIIKKENELREFKEKTEILNDILKLSYSTDFDLKNDIGIIYNYLKKINMIDLFGVFKYEKENGYYEEFIYYNNVFYNGILKPTPDLALEYIRKNNMKELDVPIFNNEIKIGNRKYILNHEIFKNKIFYSRIFLYHSGDKNASAIFIFGKNKAISEEDKKLISLIMNQIYITFQYKRVIKNYNEEKEYFKSIANKDQLTGLYSRYFFNEWIIKHVEYLKRSQKNSVFVMIDVNEFKKINDTYGHLTGDKVLKYVAEKINDGIRKMDIAVRYGGDEFLIVFPETDINHIKKKMNKICEDIQNNEFDFEVGISYGISEFSGEDYLEALKKADKEMYIMKEAKDC